MGEPSQGRCDGVAVKGGQRYARWKRSRRCGAFGRAAGQGRARNLGRQEDIDRLISRAEEADGSCLEERSFQQALEDPGETTWRYRHAGCHQARAGFRKYSKTISTERLYRSEERFNYSRTSVFLMRTLQTPSRATGNASNVPERSPGWPR